MSAKVYTVVAVAVLAVTGTLLASAGVASQTGADDRSGAPVAVDSCGVISEPGTYVLGADVASESYHCIDVRASDVALNGRGHAITVTDRLLARGRSLAAETPAQFGVGVAVGRRGPVSDVTVSNLTVAGFDAGVHVRNGTGATVRNVVATRNADGFAVEESTNVTVAGVTASRSVRDGLGVENASGVRITGAEASANGFAGVVVSNVTRGRVTDTTADDNGDGVVLEDVTGIGVHAVTASNNTIGILLLYATRSSVTGSTVERSGFAGVALASADDNVISGTQIANTTGARPVLSEPSGLWLDDATGNLIADVTAANNRNWTVYARNGSAANSIERLRINGVVTVSVAGRDVALAAADRSAACPLSASASVHDHLRVVGTSDDADWRLSGVVHPENCTASPTGG